ncbi:hypothetical protein M5K25_023416 [Dendrobium thyrsiflorum]|uniref:HAT C-terminal dimerisation domain-containing protein n=1 Tax=Dendrobium thyrsiflorum TaxID=117978 RepID=A0ABD0U8A3_DENTH
MNHRGDKVKRKVEDYELVEILMEAELMEIGISSPSSSAEAAKKYEASSFQGSYSKLWKFWAKSRDQTAVLELEVEWWIQFGDSTPELQSFAVRVLGLTCSSSGCERNWSTYSQVQTKRRNRLSTLRMNSLVYIMHNKRLRDRRLRNKGLKDDEDPLVCEDVASDNEWFIDDETDLPLSDLQLEDLSVDILRGEADQAGTSTSTTLHTSTRKRKVDNIEDDEDLTFIDTIREEYSLEDPFNDGT